MGTFGPIHWIIALVVSAIYLVPVAKILSRVGFSGWLSILALIPMVNVILFWVFAFSPWPRDREGT